MSSRDRRAMSSAAAAIAAKALALATLLVSVPVVIRAIGVEAYGVWMSAASLVSLLAFADLGVGSSLVAPLADAVARGDDGRSRAISSTAVAIAAATALSIGVAFALLTPWIDWNGVLNARGTQTRGVVALLLAASLLAHVAGTAAKIQFALQEQYVTNLWEAAGSVVTLALLWLARDAEIFTFILILAGVPPLMMAGSAIRLLWFRTDFPRPRWRAVRGDVAGELVRAGALFLVLQLASAIAFSSDSFIIARILGPEAAAAYAVPFRLFAIVNFGVALLLMPLWPAYTDAIGRGDRAWVRRAFVLSAAVAGGGSAVAGALLSWLGPGIVVWWTRAEIAPERSLLVAMAALTTLTSIGTAVSMLLYGAGRIRFLALCGGAMSVVAVVAKIICGQRWGIAGVVAGTAAVYLAVNLIPCALYLRATELVRR